VYVRARLSQLPEKLTEELCRIVHYAPTNQGTNSCGKVRSQEELVQQLNEMPLEKLSSYVDAEAAAFERAKSGLAERRKSVVGRASRRTEKFVTEFGRFLSAYSGIVEIVGLADSQFGGVAATTLALLFSVSGIP
jgi:hypothetical protein